MSNSPQTPEKCMVNNNSITRERQKELNRELSSLESKQSLSSQSSTSISEYLSFAGVCQLPGIQGASAKCINVLQHVNSMVVSENILFTTSAGSSTICAWTLLEIKDVCKFGMGYGGVKFLFPLNSNLLLSAHQDNKIRVWQIGALYNMHHLSSSRSSCFSGEREVAKHVATLPTLVNRATTFIPRKNYTKVRRHKRTLWIQHSDTISSLAISADKKRIFSGSWDKTFKVWRVSNFKCLESIKAHEDAITSLVTSKTDYLYTCSADGKIKVWEQTGTKQSHIQMTTLEHHKTAVNALVLSDDEQLLYSGSADRRILIWEREESAKHMSLAGALRGHRQAVLCLGVAGKFLCSGSADKTVRVWRRVGQSLHVCVCLLEGHVGPVKTVCMVQNLEGCDESRNFVVYSGSLDSSVRAWLVSPDKDLPDTKAYLRQCNSI